MTEPLDWSGEAPRSPRFDDIYFSPEDGLAESRAVFLAGCGLPEAWAGRARFVVGELGFGTGLNVLALAQAWAASRDPGARLHVFSVEAHLMGREDAARALNAWPELAPFAERLVAAWPAARPGMHRIELGEDVILDLFVGEAAEGLANWIGAADAWFLDGFAPARNPDMWTPELMALVAAKSAPGGRAGTFTVAGAVRAALQEAGFDVAKRPGFGRKRERLEAWLPSRRLPSPPPPRVTIVGAGIAGASLARAFRALGAEPKVMEAEAAGAGASGNPAALVMPRLDAGGGAVARLHAQAFDRATRLYRDETPEAVITEGALQLEASERDLGRFDKIAAWEGFAAGAVERIDAAAAAGALHEPDAPGALRFPGALTVEPEAILAAWLPPTAPRSMDALARGDGVWRLLSDADPASEEVSLDAEVVCLACGASRSDLSSVPLQAVRGQVTWTEASAFDGVPAAWGGYAIPTRGGVLFGATHDRDERDRSLLAEDDERNLRTLSLGRPALAARLAGLSRNALDARASVRAATPDHLPAAGAVSMPGTATPGLFTLTGFGGRGFTLAPLLAEHVAALALGAPSPLSADLAEIVSPARPSLSKLGHS